jgi:hypothetical protein
MLYVPLALRRLWALYSLQNAQDHQRILGDIPFAEVGLFKRYLKNKQKDAELPKIVQSLNAGTKYHLKTC